MSFDDWLLSLHVLSAFSYVAALVIFSVMIFLGRRTDTPEGTARLAPVAKLGNVAVGIGAGGTLIFGIWLALSVGDYDLWDGWIIAALVLWVIAAAVGARAGAEYQAGMDKAVELQAAGQTGPLHRCSVYGNAQAGQRMQKMLAMGVSRPWPEALEAMTGEKQMDATAMLDYFAPLQKWLDEQNKGQTPGW